MDKIFWITQLMVTAFVFYYIGFARGYKQGDRDCEAFYWAVLRGVNIFKFPDKDKPVKVIQE